MNMEPSFFANGENHGGVLEHPRILKEHIKIRKSWNATFGDSNNAVKVAVLEEGML